MCKLDIQSCTTVVGGDTEKDEAIGSATTSTVVFKGKAPVDSACKQKLSKVLYLHLT